ncbi:MIP/aquaporin family protein [Gymnodinialimonas sp. 2305UL16-5]|uniref:MIP/aquaporin family protein n=1 Tax=Gymnodinialimonas mytili TaxID=3126503 RepID=UPI0030AD4D1B
MGTLLQRLAAEGLGTLFLLVAVVGSGIMAADLSPDNIGVALLANAVATGVALYVLITIFGPVSGAHFNPAVTLVFALRGEIAPVLAIAYVAVQIVGGVLGVWLAHVMFDLPVLQISVTARSGPGQWVAEVTASFGLVLTILGGLRHAPGQVAALVGAYITGAYWFTASTSFANPAVTIARSFSDTFAGIGPGDAPLFIVMQIVGAILAVLVARLIFPARS